MHWFSLKACLLRCACSDAFGPWWSLQLLTRRGRRTRTRRAAAVYPKMARPPILSVALPSDTGRVLSIQSHTVQVQPAALPDPVLSSICYLGSCLLPSMIRGARTLGLCNCLYVFAHSDMDVELRFSWSTCFEFGSKPVVLWVVPCGLG